MSKSLGEKHYINLFGDDNKIRKQIKSAVTDVGTEGADAMSAGVENLFNLLKACGKMDVYNDFMSQYNSGVRRYGDLKVAVGEALVELTQPFGARLNELNSSKNVVIEEIKDSSADIRKIAQETLREVKDLVGILNPK